MRLVEDYDGKINIIAVQGKTWQIVFRLTDAAGSPIDITNVTFRGQVKKSWRDTTPIAEWTFEKNDPVNGVFTATIDAAVSFQEASTDEEALQKALDNLVETIRERVVQLESKPAIIGRRISLDEVLASRVTS